MFEDMSGLQGAPEKFVNDITDDIGALHVSLTLTGDLYL
jgi:hypothetical protein